MKASKVGNAVRSSTSDLRALYRQVCMRGIDAGVIGFGVYVGDCYHADDTALAAMESTDIVAVQQLEDGARGLLLEAHPTADEIAGAFL